MAPPSELNFATMSHRPATIYYAKTKVTNRSMDYELLDPVITAWTEKYSFHLFTTQAGIPDLKFRTVYVSSERGECFQIWIDSPVNDRVTVHAGSIETFADEEFLHDWTVPVSALGQTLEDALQLVRDWMVR